MGLQLPIKLISDGQPVAAATVNAPLQAQENNFDYLWQVLQAASAGNALFARQVTVAANVIVGNPVFFNAAHNQFEPALAAVTAVSGVPVSAPSAGVWGVCYSKTNSTLADLVLNGWVPLDISAAIGLSPGSAVPAGTYYLSAVTPGLMTAIPSATAIPVLRADGNGNVLVTTQWFDPLTNHQHYFFRLVAAPAGDYVPDLGTGRAAIHNPDATVAGWLPASSFDNAPPHAVFGYNLAADPQLLAAWPPLPPDNAVLTKNGVEVDSDLLYLDSNGIWWLSNCDNALPFSASVAVSDGSLSSVFSLSASDECPHEYDPEPTLCLYFTKFAFLSQTTVVSSLVSDDNRLKIVCQTSGQAASVGPLSVSLELQFVTDNVDPGGWLAIKGYTPETQTFHFGVVTTGIYALSSNVNLVGDVTTTQVIDTVSQTVYHGAVGVEVSPESQSEMGVELVRLDGVQEAYLYDVLYLDFPAGEDTSIRGRIRIPENLSIASPQIAIRLRLLGTATGALPGMTVTYRRIPAAAAPTALPLTDTSLGLTIAQTITVANQYVDVLTSAVAVSPGDDFLFSLSRSSTDAYTGDVGVLRQAGLISSV